jgi:hypothetical protein
MLPRSTYRILGACSFGGVALVLAACVALTLAAEDPRSYDPSQWLLSLVAVALGTVVGAAEAPRLATEEGLGAIRMAAVASLAALVLFAVVVATETAMGSSGFLRALTAAQESFAGAVGAGLVCGSVLYFPAFLIWGATGAVVFRETRRRLERRTA